MNYNVKLSGKDDGDKIFGFRPISPFFDQKNHHSKNNHMGI